MAATNTVQESFQAYPIAANGTAVVVSVADAAASNSRAVGGFFCTTAGNVKLAQAVDGSGADIVASFAAVVGQYYRWPCTLGILSAVVCSAGAAGTLFMI